MKKLLLIYLLFIIIHSDAQTKAIDSLRVLLSRAKQDSLKINTLNELAYQFLTLKKTDSALFYAQKVIVLAKPLILKKALGRAYNTMGLVYVETDKLNEAKQAYLEAKQYFQNTSLSKKNTEELIVSSNQFGFLNLNTGNNEAAIQSFREGLELARKTNNLSDMADFYLSISLVYGTQGDYSASLKNNFEGLKIHEKLGNEIGMAWSYNDIGDTYLLLGDKEKAIEYFSKCYVLAKKNKMYAQASLACYNIGDVYFQKKIFSQSMQYAQIALDLLDSTSGWYEKGNALMLIGKIYGEEGKYDKAVQKQNESITCFEKADSKLDIYEPLAEVSKIFYIKNDYQKSIEFGEKSLVLAREMKSPLAVKIATEWLFKSYQKTGNYQKAFDAHLLFINSRDSLFNENNHKELLNQEYKKQVLADSLKYETEKKISTIENQTRLKSAQTKLVFVIIGLVLAVVLGMVLLNRFRITQQQKTIIEIQNNKLETKTKEIQDSILYSKEIQNVFLKPLQSENSYLKESLLIYKPKDVVSGDFYWYKEFAGNLYVVVGDCTGHGVPGAIISVLAIQSFEKHILKTEPEKLHLLNEDIRKEFDLYYKTESHVSIGLDFSIICINKQHQTVYLSGSGGNILVKNASNTVLGHSFQSINIGGVFPNRYEPTTSCYNLNEIRSVFLYTDGIVDQRGGEENKKFGTKQLKQLLENLKTKDTPEALAKIETTLDRWRGENQQIDDMTLLGIQINE